MTSLYQTLKDYFVYEDLYTLNFIKGECSKEISWRQLKKLFKVTIKKPELGVYQENYRVACEEHLKKLSAAGRRGGKFWNFLSNLVSSEKFFFFSTAYPKLQNLELFLNTCVFVGSFFVSSSTYLLAFPGGRNLIDNLFSKQDMSSVINFYLYIYAVQTMGNFDDFIFQEDIVKMLPYVSLPASIVKTLGLPPSVMQGGEQVLTEWISFYASNLISIDTLKNLMNNQLTRAFLTNLTILLQEKIEASEGASLLQKLTSSLTKANKVQIKTSSVALSPSLSKISEQLKPSQPSKFLSAMNQSDMGQKIASNLIQSVEKIYGTPIMI